MSAKADRVIGLVRVRQPSVSRIMLKLRFALVLLFLTGNGVFADAPVGNVGPHYPQPSSDAQNPPANPGMIQQWHGQPATFQQSPQQSINVQYPRQMGSGNGYNSEDYDGEQYEDNRLRLMLYPKKLITLNETNIRTWKVNPVTNLNWNTPAATESNEPVRRSAFNQNESSEPGMTKDSAKNGTSSTRRNQTQLFVGINTSNPKDLTDKLRINDTQIFGDSSVNVSSVAGPGGGQGANVAAAVITLPNGNGTKFSAKIIPEKPVILFSQNVSRIEFNQQVNQTEDADGSEVAEVEERPQANETKKIVQVESADPATDNATDASYVEIETDGDYPDEEEGNEPEDDVPDVNPYVIILTGTKGANASLGKNISSSQPEIISDNLMYMLSNYTASNMMTERKILKELHNQKVQLNAVNTKLTAIYEILRKSNQGN